MWEFSWEISWAEWPRFAATLLGVFLALIGKMLVDWVYRGRERRKLKHLLRSELVDITGRLYPKTGSVLALYPDIWDSAISSGAVRLLSLGQTIKLTRVYGYIKGTHFEAEWVRRVIEEFNSVLPTEKEKRQWLATYVKILRDKHNERGKDLSQRIEALLKEEWWD